jgi:hypothetical protein
LLWLFWRWGLINSLPGLASNPNPPHFSVLSSWDYRREPLALGSYCFFSLFFQMESDQGWPRTVILLLLPPEKLRLQA